MKKNQKQALVMLEKLFKDEDWKDFKGKPIIPIGAETETHNLLGNLDNGFNLLLGGVSGSGKSTFFHCAIASLLKNTNPKEFKLILIDPKQAELLMYKDLPNLLYPVITNSESARCAMDWCMQEIDRRFVLFSEDEIISLDEYNKKSENKLPKILVIIDECSDLLVSDHEFFEKSILRIVTQGKLIGVNIMIGTSRPSSKDIYTQELVDSFQYRIAFLTATIEDSKTILGVEGAEKLQGNGDLLLVYPEVETPTRAQGFYVTEKKLKKPFSIKK